jgi:hypothetical protein
MEKVKAGAKRYKWPLIIGGGIAAVIVGWVVYKRSKG